MNTLPPPQPPPMMPQRSSSTKWWLLGCGGCLGLVIIAGLIFGGVIGSSFFAVFSMLKNNDAYNGALVRARESTALQESIGTPMKDGVFPQGKININNGAGTADLNFSLTGPKGGAQVFLKASKAPGGAWQYSLLEARLPDGTKIDL